uniref:Mitochondrial protein n=1 Tax=Cannabis sativa TaxID=3483 RepID=A0A803P9Y7_CANSA
MCTPSWEVDLSHTLPDIVFAVSMVSQFKHCRYKEYLEAAYRILRKSTLGYCIFVWGNLVTWRSKKQSVVTRRSAEVEYRAMANRDFRKEIFLAVVGDFGYCLDQ